MRRGSKKSNFFKSLFTKKIIKIAVVIFAVVALATTFWLVQNPQILDSRAYVDPKVKKSFGCPPGYYRQWTRCVRTAPTPIKKSTSIPKVTPNSGIKCSSGYYLSGNRCLRINATPTPYKPAPPPAKAPPPPAKATPPRSNCPPAGSLSGTTYCSGGNLCARMNNGSCGTTTQCWPSSACAN